MIRKMTPQATCYVMPDHKLQAALAREARCLTFDFMQLRNGRLAPTHELKKQFSCRGWTDRLRGSVAKGL